MNYHEKLVIGTRGSKLALCQTQQIKESILGFYPGIEVQIEVIKTKGDLNLHKSLDKLGGKSVFTSEIELEILNKNIHFAVHSLKDLPMRIPDGLIYLGSPKREDPRDVFISNKWNQINQIPQNGIIATGSIRRSSQIKILRPDIEIVGLRGNVETRLAKLNKNNWDGLITAAAAMNRLSLNNKITQYLDIENFTPAAGQGAIGIELNNQDESLIELLLPIVDSETTLCCKAERLFLSYINCGCQNPLGCYARVMNEELLITAYIGNYRSSKVIYKEVKGPPDSYKNLVFQLGDEVLKYNLKDYINN